MNFTETIWENKKRFNFKKCPNGFLTENCLIEIYSHLFVNGDCSEFAKHLFSALNHLNNFSSFPSACNNKEIDFQDYLIALSTLMRGNFDEKIKWLFSFYDFKQDGKISVDVSVSKKLIIFYLLLNKIWIVIKGSRKLNLVRL